MLLHLLRGALIVLATAVTLLYVLPLQQTDVNQEASRLALNFNEILITVIVTIAIAGLIIAGDIYNKRKSLAAFSGVVLGLLIGLTAAYALSFVVDLFGTIVAPGDEELKTVLEGVKVLIGLVTCYLGISIVVQTKDDFRFVIPYVEFAKEIRGNRPVLLDTSAIIDGRIVNILDTNIMQGTLIVPRFVLHELQAIADSSDKLRRSRGRLGLDNLQKLPASPAAEVLIQDVDVDGGTVDHMLVTLAQQRNARIMTNDFNLNKIATLRGVTVINSNDLAKSLRPVVLPGEEMTVKIIKPGESPTQGVGYLDDGTMVVVEQARGRINDEVKVVVTSTLQTSAGRMIFSRVADGDGDGQRARPRPREGHAPAHGASQPPHRQPDDSERGATGRNPRRTS